jgi:hypothetical protein
MPKIKAIMAITNNMCMMPVAEYRNTPNAHPMSSITAMIYNSEFIVIFLINDFHRCINNSTTYGNVLIFMR